MKKKNLKSLSLNKKIVSHMSIQLLNGGYKEGENHTTADSVYICAPWEDVTYPTDIYCMSHAPECY